MRHTLTGAKEQSRAPHIAEYVRLLPLLLAFTVIVILFAKNDLEGDEGRYLMFAENLTHGFYSPRDTINLWNGPGYPLVLAPFVAFNIPLIVPTLANAVFLFLGVAYVYCTLRLYVRKSRALLAAYLFGLYPANLVALPLLVTEALAAFLVCGYIYHFASLFVRRPGVRRHLLLAAFYLAYLALTKVLFGYVIAGLLVVAAVAAIWAVIRRRGNRIGALPMLAVCALALVLCLPYLVYTRSLTGKVFYWSDAGGSSLYWMSTPYWDELGDWHTNRAVFEDPSLEEHRGVLAQILSLDSVERDEAFKARALENIVRHPAKFLYNWAANVGRLLFNFPYSHTPQRSSPGFPVKVAA